MYIFDVDGTLLNTIDTISYYINEECKKIGILPFSKDLVKKYTGHGTKYLIDSLLSHVGIDDNEIKKSFMNSYIQNYEKNPSYLTTCYDGVKEALDNIKKRDYIVCFSNKTHSVLKKVLDDIFGCDYFNYILGQKEEIKSKPNPMGLYHIIDLFKQKKTDVLYFGDSEIDIQCGKNASVFTVAVSWGFRDLDTIKKQSPNLIINHPKEIVEVKII